MPRSAQAAAWARAVSTGIELMTTSVAHRCAIAADRTLGPEQRPRRRPRPELSMQTTTPAASSGHREARGGARAALGPPVPAEAAGSESLRRRALIPADERGHGCAFAKRGLETRCEGRRRRDLEGGAAASS